MLPPRARLRHSKEIGLVRQRGRRWQHPLVVLFVYRQPRESSASSRFAFAVGRYVGNATRRNQVKRRIREIVRRHYNQLVPGYDCLWVARPAAATASHPEIEQAVIQLLTSGGLIVDETDRAKSTPGGSLS